MTVTVYYGPMKSGKTRRLVKTGLDLLSENKSFLCFKPRQDTRNLGVIYSRQPELPSLQAISLYSPAEIFTWILADTDISQVLPDVKDNCISIEQMYGATKRINDLYAILFDEAFMWDSQFIKLLQLLKRTDIQVYIATLTRDFKRDYFPLMDQMGTYRYTTQHLLELCDQHVICTGICEVCSGVGTETQRLTNGKPSSRAENAFLIDEASYQIRCERCHQITE